jgi:hypothetical protein
MVTKTIINPEKLKTPSEIADVIALLDEFEKINQVPAAIVMRQNLSFGESYSILSETDARNNLQKVRGRDIYLKVWSKQYFIDLLASYRA